MKLLWYVVLWNSAGAPNHDARFPWVAVALCYSLQDAIRLVDGPTVKVRETMAQVLIQDVTGQPLRFSEERLPRGRWVK